MATDEEYLDNLLKSLTGGDEPIMEPADEPEDVADENDNLEPEVEAEAAKGEGADDRIKNVQPDTEAGDGMEGLQSDTGFCIRLYVFNSVVSRRRY